MWPIPRALASSSARGRGKVPATPVHLVPKEVAFQAAWPATRAPGRKRRRRLCSVPPLHWCRQLLRPLSVRDCLPTSILSTWIASVQVCCPLASARQLPEALIGQSWVEVALTLQDSAICTPHRGVPGTVECRDFSWHWSWGVLPHCNLANAPYP